MRASLALPWAIAGPKPPRHKAAAPAPAPIVWTKRRRLKPLSRDTTIVPSRCRARWRIRVLASTVAEGLDSVNRGRKQGSCRRRHIGRERIEQVNEGDAHRREVLHVVGQH